MVVAMANLGCFQQSLLKDRSESGADHVDVKAMELELHQRWIRFCVIRARLNNKRWPTVYAADRSTAHFDRGQLCPERAARALVSSAPYQNRNRTSIESKRGLRPLTQTGPAVRRIRLGAAPPTRITEPTFGNGIAKPRSSPTLASDTLWAFLSGCDQSTDGSSAIALTLVAELRSGLTGCAAAHAASAMAVRHTIATPVKPANTPCKRLVIFSIPAFPNCQRSDQR